MIEFREFTDDDASFVIAHLNNKDVVRYLTARIPYPYTQEDFDEWLNVLSQNSINRAIVYEGELAGCIGVGRGEFEYCRKGEIGYWLAEPFWGKGIVSAAIAKMTDYIFAETDIVRLSASVYSPNVASVLALEKNGYQHEGMLRQAIFKDDEFFDELILGKIKY